MDYRDVTVRESLKHVSLGMERWGFLFSAVSSPIVYFLTTTRAVCPNINPIMHCAHVCDVNYAACYCYYWVYICYFPCAQTNQKHKNILFISHYPGRQERNIIIIINQKDLKAKLYMTNTLGNVAALTNISRETIIATVLCSIPKNNFSPFPSLGLFLACS